MDGSGAGQTEATRDDHALNLTRTLADLEDLGISVESRYRVLLHEAVAAEDLRGDAGRRDGRLRRVELCHCGGLFDVLDGATTGMELVLEPGGLVGQQTGGLDHHSHVCDLERDALVDSDGSAERYARLGVFAGGLKAGLGQPDREGADRDASVIKSLEELLEAGTLLAEQVLDRDAA